MALNPTLAAALEGQAIRQFTAIRIEFSDAYVINLLDGSGTVTFTVDGSPVTFTGRDPTYGMLASATTLRETIATESPRFTFSLMPPTADAVGSLADPAHQGSPVRVWWGVVNEMTGAAIGVPELLWAGRLDFVKTILAEGSLIAEVETVSAYDRLYVVEEGARLNGVFHKSIWPGETGLDFVVAAGLTQYWGTEAPAAPIKSMPSTYPGAGGGPVRDRGGQVRSH